MIEKITEWALVVLPGSIIALLLVFSVLCYAIWRLFSKFVSLHETNLKSIEQLASINERAIKNQSVVLDDHIKLNDKLKKEVNSLEDKIAAMSAEMTREKSTSNELAIKETRALSSEFEKFRLEAFQTRKLAMELSTKIEIIYKEKIEKDISPKDQLDRIAIQTRAASADARDEISLAEETKNFKAEVAKLERKRRWSNFPVSLSPLSGALELKSELEASDITCSVYFSGTTSDEEGVDTGLYGAAKDHVGIWLGYRVPIDVIKTSFAIARRHWSFLRYISLSNSDRTPPDYVHDQIYFGGATSTVKRDNLKKISDEVFARLLSCETAEQFHGLIRAINR